jgi:hypothetical protein
MVETIHYTLEEISEAFDGPDTGVSRLDKMMAERNGVPHAITAGGDVEGSRKDGDPK